MKTASEILGLTQPGDLFSPDASSIRTEYKKLVKMWHPDVHADPVMASKVMIRINELYEQGLDLISKGKWAQSNFLQLKSTTGQLHKIRFYVERPFVLGTSYICNTIAVYTFDKKHKAYYDNFMAQAKNLKYQDSHMETEFKRYMPVVKANFETDDSFVIIIDKPPDVFSLRDILAYYKGTLPDRHVAWILSTLYYLACFLHYNSLSHNGITLDNYFICPSKHSGMLLGGWMYSVKQGEKMLGAPRSVFENMSYKTKTDKLGSYATDLDCIRQIGRELCGDVTGKDLSTSVPKPIVDWLLGASTKDPTSEYYVAWSQVLDAGYGKRRFVEMAIDSKDLYPSFNK